MRGAVGLIPAAGSGSRLGLAGSKALAPVRWGGGGSRPAIDGLLEVLAAAGIEEAIVVVRRGRDELREGLGERAGRLPRLRFVPTAPTRSIPETVDRARSAIGRRQVLLGFPDVLLRPVDAARELLGVRHRSGADVALALFPSERPDKTDMVEVEGDRVTGFRIKPGPCELDCTWLLAAWGAAFTEYLHHHLARSEGEPPPGSPLTELQMSQVLQAALADGLTIAARRFPDGRFLDIGTPEDLARARRGPDSTREAPARGR